MATKDTLRADLQGHRKARRELETTVLGSVLAAIETAEKSGKTAKVFTEDEIEKAIAAAVKTRRDSAQIYADAGAADRATREAAEADFLAQYLPKALTEAEIEALVSSVVTEVVGDEIPSKKHFGAVMKSVRAQAGNAADGKTVAAVVTRQLG